MTYSFSEVINRSNYENIRTLHICGDEIIFRKKDNEFDVLQIKESSFYWISVSKLLLFRNICEVNDKHEINKTNETYINLKHALEDSLDRKYRVLITSEKYVFDFLKEMNDVI